MGRIKLKNKEKKSKIVFELIQLCFRNQKKYILLLLFISLPKVILPFVTLLSLQTILNSGQEKAFMDLALVMVVYFLGLLMTNIINSIFEYVQGLFKVRFNYDVSCMIIDKSKALSLSDYENSETYDKLQRALKETQTPYNCIMSVIDILNSLVALIGSLLILIMWKWYVILIIMIVPIISFFFTILIGRFEFKVLQERITDIRKINYFRTLVNDVNSCKENKVLGTEGILYSRFRNLFEEFIVKDKKILGYKALNAVIFKVLETLIGILIVCFVVYSLTLKKILVGTANTYIRCIWNVITITDSLINSVAKIYNKLQYLRNLFGFLDATNLEESIGNGEMNISNIESIEFKNVSFRYREDLSYALKNINLKINRSEKIVIVGDNGSGKSTFIKMLCNLYSEYEGEILVNGILLDKTNRSDFNDKLAVVYQDFVKYEFSLKENLKFGNKKLQMMRFALQ